MSKKNKRQEKNGDHWLEDTINLIKEVENAILKLGGINESIKEMRDISLSEIRTLDAMEFQLTSAVERSKEKYVTTDHLYDEEATKHTVYSEEVQAIAKGKK
jgi:hypothetical protein